MREICTKGLICLDDSYGFVYKIAFISYTLREDESYVYRYEPVYPVIDLLPPALFQGIPGLDLDARRDSYARENMVPVFISERTPGENRQNLWQLLEKAEMDYLNRLQWLISTQSKYSGDDLYVKAYEASDEKRVHRVEDIRQYGKRAVDIYRNLLMIICYGDDLIAPGYEINDETRGLYYPLLMDLYKMEKAYIDAQQAQGIRRAAIEGRFKGRKPITIDDTKLAEVIGNYRAERLSADQAAQKLGLSRSSFFRRLKTWS